MVHGVSNLARWAALCFLLAVAVPALADDGPYAEGPSPQLLERIESWLEALPGATPAGREAIVGHLVRVGPPAWPLLEAAVDSPEYETAEGAIRALGASGDPRAADLLAAAAGDRKRFLNLRVEAIQALGREGRAVAARSLGEIALGGQPELRLAAVRALGRTSAREGVDALLAVAAEDRSLREEALEALEAGTGQRFGDNLEKWQRWWRIERWTFAED